VAVLVGAHEVEDRQLGVRRGGLHGLAVHAEEAAVPLEEAPEAVGLAADEEGQGRLLAGDGHEVVAEAPENELALGKLAKGDAGLPGGAPLLQGLGPLPEKRRHGHGLQDSVK